MEGDSPSEQSVQEWLSTLDMQKCVMWSNSSLPEKLKSPPFRIPTSHPKADQINKVLEESLLIQSSTIPNEDVWFSLNHFIISNSCMAISGFLAKYLSALGVEDVKIVHGVLKFPKHPEGKKGIRHVFLDIDGHFIDNTYIHFRDDKTPDENFDTFLKFSHDTKLPQNYSRDPKDTSVDLLHGSDMHVHGDTNVQYVESSCKDTFNAHKFLAYIKKGVDLNPGPHVYDTLMRHFIKEEFDLDIPDVSEEMEKKCWSCEAKSNDLKTCTGCKVARYCNKECLTADWNIHKIAHKMTKNEQKRKEQKDFYASLNDDAATTSSSSTTSTVTTSTAAISSPLTSTSTTTTSTTPLQLPSSSIPSTAKHTATLIFLHGLGDTGHSWASTLASKRPPHVKIVCPHADKMPVTLNGGMSMPSWFDLTSLDPNGPEDSAGIKKACQVIIGLIEQEIKAGIPSNRIMLGGFSQGGALALYTALNTDHKLGGVVGLSCWYPLHKTLAKGGNQINLDTPFLQAHGTSDPVVKLSFGKLTATLLKSLVKSYEFETYENMGHSSCATEMHDVNVFMAKCLPS